MWPTLLLLTTWGCGPVTIATDTETDTVDTVPQATEPTVDTDTGVPDADDTEELGSPSDPIFNLDFVHTLDITLPLDGYQALAEDPWTYTQGDVVFDGQAVDAVGVRLKGAWGSFESLDSKANFKIDFNRYVDGQTLWGIEQLTVNNSKVDCSFLRENMAYTTIAAVGLHETRTAYVWVTLNDQDYGLYVLIETPDDRWLDETFDDPDGNLYDGKYIFTEDWDFVSMVDFTPGLQVYFELEEGTDVGMVDVSAVTDALMAARSSDDGYALLGAVIDWDQILRVWAAEQWVGQLDGYFLNQNNYRVYFNPASGLMEMLPWDMDYSFYHSSDWGMNWDRPAGQLASFCVSDDTCMTALKAASDEVLEAVEGAGLAEHLEAMVTLTEDHSSRDPRACTDPMDVLRRQQDMREWVQWRSDEVRQLWD